jgi:hypothetical protein
MGTSASTAADAASVKLAPETAASSVSVTVSENAATQPEEVSAPRPIADTHAGLQHVMGFWRGVLAMTTDEAPVLLARVVFLDRHGTARSGSLLRVHPDTASGALVDLEFVETDGSRSRETRSLRDHLLVPVNPRTSLFLEGFTRGHVGPTWALLSRAWLIKLVNFPSSIKPWEDGKVLGSSIGNRPEFLREREIRYGILCSSGPFHPPPQCASGAHSGS